MSRYEVRFEVRAKIVVSRLDNKEWYGVLRVDDRPMVEVYRPTEREVRAALQAEWRNIKVAVADALDAAEREVEK